MLILCHFYFDAVDFIRFDMAATAMIFMLSLFPSKCNISHLDFILCNFSKRFFFSSLLFINDCLNILCLFYKFLCVRMQSFKWNSLHFSIWFCANRKLNGTQNFSNRIKSNEKMNEIIDTTERISTGWLKIWIYIWSILWVCHASNTDRHVYAHSTHSPYELICIHQDEYL